MTERAGAAENEEQIRKFILREARLLDERRFDEWAALFADDGEYWVPSRPDQATPHDHVSLFFDDKETLLTRVRRLNHSKIHVQTPPSRTCHLVVNIEVEMNADGAAAPMTAPITAHANFAMFEYRPGWEQTAYAGTYDYVLRRDGARISIVRKKVNLINCDAAMPPLAVPF
ncbi:MAG: aromatic-ring-hydroxylating dioxygenase subunit beta [Alphaproteobacteria bacterium]|nr:aromatic-ring-hydroxylating dioxygenase subunit beta [Alphaproteobacteria bacterium]